MERISTYFEQIQHDIQRSTWVIHEDVILRQIDTQEGYLKGSLYLYDGFVLHAAECVKIQDGKPERVKYRYHLQDQNARFVARWDNAPHHEHIATYPFHRYCQDGEIIESSPMDIPQVLQELEKIIGGEYA